MTSMQSLSLSGFLDMNGSWKRRGSGAFCVASLFCSKLTKKTGEKLLDRAHCLDSVFTLEHPTLTERNNNLFGREFVLGRLYFDIFNYYCCAVFCFMLFLPLECFVLLSLHRASWAWAQDDCASSQNLFSF